jgi:hypothetical protein
MKSVMHSVTSCSLLMVLALAFGCSDIPREHVGTSSAALSGPNGISADLVLDSQWDQGYCARVVVSNHHPSATTGSWSVGLNLGPSTTFTTWDGVFSGNTGSVTVTPDSSNMAILPAESKQFGLCASIPSPGILPSITAVTSDLPPLAGAVVSEYKFDAAVDPLVSPDFPTELWASFYRPQALEDGRQYPLLVFMHGNHATCGRGTNPRIDDDNSYALTGTCPATHPIIVPNHRGYDYIATDLAERGYFVVSINTNRGINGAPGTTDDEFSIGPRGRLLLRHLERLSRWDAGTEATPAELGVDLHNRIDFGEVGLFGHSRGGESVRFAYNEYRGSGSPWPALIQEPVTFRGVFEIGPTDELVGGQRVNISETPWNVLLPACDWDQSDLPGVRVFDRTLNVAEATPFFKSFYHVWGANHNFYNSEWMSADASIPGGNRGCFNHTPLFDPNGSGSPEQRETGRFAAVSFFTANVGPNRDETANALFDPAFPLPVAYRVGRGYHPGGSSALSLRLEDFIGPAGTSSYGLPNDTGGTLTVSHIAVSPHDPSHRVAFISDIVASPSTFFQTNFAPLGSSFNLTSYDFLDIRADRAGLSIDDPTVVTFSVELVNGDDSRSSSVPIDPYLVLGAPPRGGTTLPTARIPLSAFSGAQLASVRAVRLTFTTPFPAGASLYVANIRATRLVTPGTPPSAAPSLLQAAGGATAPSTQRSVAVPPATTAGNAIESVKSVDSNTVAITLRSTRFFEPRAANLVLSLGAERGARVQPPVSGDLYTVTFLLSREAFNRLGAREPLRVHYGSHDDASWNFGLLDKSRLDR